MDAFAKQACFAHIVTPHTLCCYCILCRITLVALGSLVGGVALRPNTPLVAMVVSAVVIVGFTVAINNTFAKGWIPGELLRPQPILLWVDGEHKKTYATCSSVSHWQGLCCCSSCTVMAALV
jgi:hypothetical protein